MNKIDKIHLTGLPANTTGGGSPITLNGVTQPGTTTDSILVTKPAIDGNFILTVSIFYKGGSSSQEDALIINDIPAILSNVSISPSKHTTSNNCQGATNGFFKRQFKYDVEDDNGAYDVLDPHIMEALPLSSGNTITVTVPLPLKPPDVTIETVQKNIISTIDIRCDMTVQPYVLTMQIKEDDKPARTGPIPTITQDVTYAVER